MKRLNDYCNGTLAGAIGFFASKVDLPIPAQLTLNGAISAAAMLMIYNDPVHANSEVEVKKLWLVLGALTPTVVGLILDYGLQSPDYLNNPFMITCMALPQVFSLVMQHKTKWEYSNVGDAQVDSATFPINVAIRH